MNKYKNKTNGEIVYADKSKKGFVFGGNEVPEGSYLVYRGSAGDQMQQVIFKKSFEETYSAMGGMVEGSGEAPTPLMTPGESVANSPLGGKKA